MVLGGDKLYYPYQQPTFWDGLANGLLQGMQKRQEAKQNADAWSQMVNFSDKLKNLDTGGKMQLQYNPTPQGTNVVNNATQQLATNPNTQGLFGSTDFNAQPTAQGLWQGGLMGKPGQMQQPTVNEYNQPLTDEQPKPDYTLKNNFLPDNVTKTISKTPTLSEYKAMVRSQIPIAAKELADKGHDPAKFMPYLLQMTNDKIGDYTTDYNNNMASTLMNKFNASNNPTERAFMAAQMKKYGIELDPQMIKTLSPEYKMNVVNRGDVQSLILHDPRTGQVIDAGDLSVGINPSTKYSADMGYQGKIDSAHITGQYGLQRSVIGASRGRESNKVYGPGTLNGKQIDPSKLEKYSDRYDEIMSDIWESSTPGERASKVNRYASELNALGNALDIDVQNDVDYITKTNPLGE